MPSTFDYNPQAKYEVRSFDVPYQEALGQPWEATIYQPEGDGPFPAILFVHGGAWNAGTRTGQEIFNTGLAASGLVIVSIDFRLAPDHPYPAQLRCPMVKISRLGVQRFAGLRRRAGVVQRRSHPDAGGHATS